jgi:predicted DNA-binding transcriptional regulator YafY
MGQTPITSPVLEPDIRILYTNHRGETAVRRIVPKRVWFGRTEWHPEPQWLLEAFDLERQAMRSYALKEIRSFF